MINVSLSLDSFEYFLMIMVRITGFLFVAPFWGQQGIPGRAKIGLGFFFSLILYHVLPTPDLEYATVTGYAVIVLKEGITGLLIGFVANICSSIILFAGTIIDQNLGLSMATEYDPTMQTQVTVSGNLYYYLVMLLLLASHLDTYLIKAMVDTYTLIPIGGQIFDTESMLNSMVQFMTDSFVLGFRIALPVFACIMILNCVLGIMAKIAPQLNMFAVGIQLKLILGIAVMLVTVQLLPYVSDFIFVEIKKMTVSIVQGMY